ncbi:hypothetical protein BBH99_15270 [Chryseobacterium contaminans]|uniref:Lysine N6-hydroxylase n=1 Tax=Chryseobacterium contaminans TaxID=1423959 RepID=A0A1M7F2M5_9FLAO|nr:SidA/IucD/PvdA family monooxygenase [Chryseobacterium contaminans]OCA67904.1 hypothetical protein BBH99_15270 [Chryseobacterium contaminans]SHL98334.1 lysine N6-hydroxylase [Chryseobacterium contaminans]
MKYDIIGIGIGPFNLSLAALLEEHNLKTIFFDKAPRFEWHSGLMIDRTTLQVPFLADLVTIVNPKSPFTYINYLREQGKIFRFCFKESFYVTRMEYNLYCKWVASQIESLNFSHTVTEIDYNEIHECYEVSVIDLINCEKKVYLTDKIVLGVGSIPNVPKITERFSKEHIFHSSEYLHRKQYIKKGSTITVLGSGQSGGEVFFDLLSSRPDLELKLNWITAADRFFPMENSKFTYEFTSMDYISYFNRLPLAKRREVINKQDILYKGINDELISTIYDELYHQQMKEEQPLPVKILTNSLLEDMEYGENYTLKMRHLEEEKTFSVDTDYLILATGYRYEVPHFLQPIEGRLNKSENDGTLLSSENYTVDVNDNEIFMQNGCVDSQGIITSDLGMGPYRNATIINKILGHEYYPLEKNIAFQHFGALETI